MAKRRHKAKVTRPRVQRVVKTKTATRARRVRAPKIHATNTTIPALTERFKQLGAAGEPARHHLGAPPHFTLREQAAGPAGPRPTGAGDGAGEGVMGIVVGMLIASAALLFVVALRPLPERRCDQSERLPYRLPRAQINRLLAKILSTK
jgi:hypothetical protein